MKWEDDIMNICFVLFFVFIRRQVTIPNTGEGPIKFYQTSFFWLRLLEGYFVKAWNSSRKYAWCFNHNIAADNHRKRQNQWAHSPHNTYACNVDLLIKIALYK